MKFKTQLIKTKMEKLSKMRILGGEITIISIMFDVDSKMGKMLTKYPLVQEKAIMVLLKEWI